MMDATTPIPCIPDRHYANPPVVEALCEVYFAGGRWDGTTPGLFYEKVRADYPQKSPVILGEFGLSVGFGDVPFQPHSAPVEQRIRFTRFDNSRVLQLSRDLLIVNQLLPYAHYEAWREVALETVEYYRGLVTPTGIDRLGMRYINRIKLPAAGNILQTEEYFRIYPELPSELGAAHGQFMLQLAIAPIYPNHQLTVTLAPLLPSETPEHMTFLLDIYDVLPLQGRDAFAELPRLLDEAHKFIIHTFENTITDSARKHFSEGNP